MMKTLAALALALAACTANAPAPMPDAAGSGSGAGSNLPFGATCTVTSDTSTECASGVCTNSFDQLGHDICSQKCTMLMATDPTCPAGTSQKCNMKGYCKP
ncbi:MAG: hypothetical protein JO257_09180 [Deltaproteobacteria bacterium]|nr:hypothetical protein [Deltaproteobacteria bacterium]